MEAPYDGKPPSVIAGKMLCKGHLQAGLCATTRDCGKGLSGIRRSPSNPAFLHISDNSVKVYASPAGVSLSMVTLNKAGMGGDTLSSLGTNERVTIWPPGRNAAPIFFSRTTLSEGSKW